MQNEIIDIQFLRSLAPFTNRATAISKLQSLTWSVGKPAVATYKVGSETRGLLAIGIADGVGKCRILADDEDFQTLKIYTEALNKKVDDYIEVTDAWKEVVDAWRSVTDDRLVELEGKSHVQNTDTGTTSPTFQVDSTSNGPKLKGKGGDLELRNAGDTDYAGLTLGNITIKGNVTQEGDTFISQAETVEINDNLLLINKGEVGAGVTKGIAGIEIDRGTLPNYQIVFDESDKRFKAGEVGNIWPLALRDEEVNMVDGMFVTWDSATKRLKTTNIVPYNRPLSFKLNPEIADATIRMRFGEGGLELSMDGSDGILSAIPEVDRDGNKYSVITSNTNGIILGDYSGSNDEFILDIKNSSFINPKLGKDVIMGGKNAYFMYYSHLMGSPNRIVASCNVKAPSFYRVSDESEVLYHADIIDDLVTGGTGKVLSAEQGKILSTKVNEIGDTYLPLSAGSGKHVTGDLYLDQKIYMKTLKPIYVQDSKGNYMQVLQGATLDGEEVIQLGASSKIRVESVTDFSKAVKFKDTVTLGTNSKLYYEVSSSSSRTILDPAGGNIVLGNVNVQDMKFSTAVGKDLYHLEGTTPYKIWTAHSFDPDSKANRINPVVEQTLTLNTSTTGYKVKLGADDTGYPGMFVSTQAGVSKSSLYYSPKSDAWEIFTGAQSGVIATQNWVIDQVSTIFYARGFEVRKLNSAVNLDSDLLYGGAAVNYSDLTYWTNAPEGFSYGTVYQLGLQDYTNLNAQLAFDIIHTSDTDQKTNHLWFRTSGKAGYGVAGWKRVVTADELEGYVPSGDLSNYYTKTQSDARYWTKVELVDPVTITDLNAYLPPILNNYLPLIGGTLTGQLTIKQSVDIKLRLQSTDADNYCIIQAIDSQASQLGVFGYAGDKWAIGHGGTYYEIWDKYNLANPVTYTTNTYNHATLTNKDGQYFTYIKAGTNGLLPHSQVTLANGGAGFLGTSDQSFNAGYINYLYTNKISFGVNGPYIIGGTSATQFLDANGGVQKVATGGLYVGVSYASDALNLVPASGIYSHGNIRTSGWLEFTNNKWTDEGGVYKEATGSLKVLWTDVAGPTQYGSILQINSRLGHWNTQLWIDQTNTSGNNGKLRYRSTKVFSSVEWNDWTTIATEPYVSSNYLPLTGGTLSGNLTINTVGGTTFVINNNDTNGSETFMRVLRKGTASAAIGFMDSLGAYIYNYNSKKYLFIDNDGYARVGTTSGSTRLALITDIPTVSGYLPLSGGTLTGALTMRSRRNNVVVDVVGGAGNTWDEGAGALSIQVPNDPGQTPLILARRSGASINTTVATERLLSMELLDTGHSFIIGMSGSEALQLDWTSGKAGTGKLFGKTIATTDQIPSLNGYATQSWANGQFAPLKNYFVTSNYASIATTGNEMCIGSLTSGNSIINVNYRNGTGTTSPSTWYWRAGSSTTWANAYWGNLYMNNNLVATQTWSNSQYPLKTGAGASGTWDINISGNASTASAASKLGSTTIGGSAKPIYLSSGTPTACSATVGSATVPVYMNAGTITQCSTTLGVSITGNAATATNATQLGGTAASSYVKANDNISRLTNDSGYATQEWVNSQNFVKSTSTKKVTDIQVVDALPATQASGVLYLVVK